MRITGFGWLIILFVCFGLPIEGNVFADESKIFDLSYNMIESNGDDQRLIMTVKLKVKNTFPAAMYDVIARVNYTNKVLIDTNEISLGNIDAGEIAISSESFTVAIDTSSANQEPLRTQTVWLVQYKDANGKSFVEEVLLQ